VFVSSPAQLMGTITMDLLGASQGALQLGDAEAVHHAVEAGGIKVWGMDKATVVAVWTIIIFAYYILATLLPIDKIIGRIYPLFGALLLFMSVGMVYGLVSAHFSAVDPIEFFRTINADGQGLTLEKFTQNFQVKGDVPIWPLLFLTISCGALSGFHATQTPLMARCAENEKEGRFIFYGAMIAEGVIALIWCMVGLALGQLLIGPISDKYGRKNPLIISLVIYLISTLAIIIFPNVYAMITLRFIQGVSSAGAVVISRAISTDLYQGRELAAFFALLMAVNGLAPIFSPILGSLLLQLTDWRGIFVTLAVIGIILLVVSFKFHESLESNKHLNLPITKTYYSIILVAKNKLFFSLVIIQGFSLAAMFSSPIKISI